MLFGFCCNPPLEDDTHLEPSKMRRNSFSRSKTISYLPENRHRSEHSWEYLNKQRYDFLLKLFEETQIFDSKQHILFQVLSFLKLPDFTGCTHLIAMEDFWTKAAPPEEVKKDTVMQVLDSHVDGCIMVDSVDFTHVQWISESEYVYLRGYIMKNDTERYFGGEKAPGYDFASPTYTVSATYTVSPRRSSYLDSMVALEPVISRVQRFSDDEDFALHPNPHLGIKVFPPTASAEEGSIIKIYNEGVETHIHLPFN